MVLGAVSATDGGTTIALGGRKQRDVLATLISTRSRPISRDALLDAIWGDAPPDAAVSSLHAYISRLRRALGSDRIANRAAGYILRLEPDELDAEVFERLIDEARRSVAAEILERGSEQYADALALWKGDPFAGADDTDVVAGERTRLQNLQRSAWEEWLDVLLELGHHTRVADIAAPVVAVNTFHEGLWQRFALGLYRSGRQADAVRALSECRKTLGDELGLEPGPDLTDLEDRILRHDPSLEWHPAARTGHGEASPAGTGRPPPSRPRHLTTFVGRTAELDELETLIQRERVVTVVGPGGVGKTRLGFAVTERATMPSIEIELADLTADGLGSEALRAVGASESGEANAPAHFAAAIKTNTLVLLDNAEHMIDEVAEFVDRVATLSDHPRFLVTSRERLAISGEHVWLAGAMSVPSDAEDGGASDAVQLFLTRAESQGVSIGADNVAAVGRICRLLDGMPLAIELAAAGIAAYALSEIERQITSESGLLAMERRGANARHRTLGAAVAWSYDRLNDYEQRVFRRLSVFAGSFTIDAACAIVSDESVSSGDVRHAVGSLAGKSLLSRVDPADDRYRFLLPTMEFAARTLADHGGTDVFSLAHARYFAEWIVAADAELVGPDQEVWMDRIAVEQPNIDAAIESAVDLERPALAVELGFGGSWFWIVRGNFVHGLAQIGHILDVSEGVSTDRRNVVLERAGILAAEMGDIGRAGSYLESALQGHIAVGDSLAAGKASFNLAVIRQHMGALEDAVELTLEGLNLVRESSEWEPRLDVNALSNLTSQLIDLDRFDEAAAAVDELKTQAARSGDPRSRMIAATTEGLIRATTGEPDAAAVLREAARLAEELGDHSKHAFALRHAAYLELMDANHGAARALLEQAWNIVSGLEQTTGILCVAAGIGWCEAYDHNTRSHRLSEGLRASLAEPVVQIEAALVLNAGAAVLARAGRFECVETILTTVAIHRNQWKAVAPPWERNLLCQAGLDAFALRPPASTGAAHGDDLRAAARLVLGELRVIEEASSHQPVEPGHRD